MPLSARSPEALRDLARRYRDWLGAEHPDAGAPLRGTADLDATAPVGALYIAAGANATYLDDLEVWVTPAP